MREVESGSPQSGNKSLVAGMHLISMKEGVSEAKQLDDIGLFDKVQGPEGLIAKLQMMDTELS